MSPQPLWAPWPFIVPSLFVETLRKNPTSVTPPHLHMVDKQALPYRRSTYPVAGQTQVSQIFFALQNFISGLYEILVDDYLFRGLCAVFGRTRSWRCKTLRNEVLPLLQS